VAVDISPPGLRWSMTDNPDDEPDIENPLIQSMMFTELFRSLEAIDSKRVDDFWSILEDTVLEILNINGNKSCGNTRRG